MESQSLDCLQVRLAVVERRLRIAFVAGVTSLIVVVLLAVAVQHAASQTTVIRAREIHLVDATGRERIRMVAEEGPLKYTQIWLSDASGTSRLGLTILRQGEAAISLKGARQGGIFLDASGSILLKDESGKGSLHLNTWPLGSYVLLSGAGKASASLSMDFNVPSVTVTDMNGYSATLGGTQLKTTSTGMVEKRSAASLMLVDKDQNVIWSAP